ncbi:MAG: class I SAM-dependent methyltransferase [Bacillota bacterium]|jgi:tRNA (adenine22-N1)-methyltransferase|nr:class I SAM-dependent methyltransferase [Bacillota bacterium]NLM08425.1 SAM-dependent methyltransferase [Clostridiales Family XIII bacterium]
MLRLSERLAAIADYVREGETIADIGTDHGLLPIFLLQQKRSPKVILSDIRQGPLRKAEENLAIYTPGIEADLRLGSGLETLKNSEVDVVIIAGMGGHMICDIMAANPEKTRSFPKFILQPRTAQDKLRMWLCKNGYVIVHERLVRERNKICEIIVVDTTLRQERVINENELKTKLFDLEFEISPLLFLNGDPLLKEWIEYKIKTEEEIIESIRTKGSKASLSKLNNHEQRLKKLRELYKRCLFS